MKFESVFKMSRSAMEHKGFTFVWGESCYSCCVCYKGLWIGTFTTTRRYAIPRKQIYECLTT
jgi:hypothetical protein